MSGSRKGKVGSSWNLAGTNTSNSTSMLTAATTGTAGVFPEWWLTA